MAQVTGDAVKKMKTAEATSISGIEGKASTQDVVQSVMSAQESLQTALAIRDKSVVGLPGNQPHGDLTRCAPRASAGPSAPAS